MYVFSDLVNLLSSSPNTALYLQCGVSASPVKKDLWKHAKMAKIKTKQKSHICFCLHYQLGMWYIIFNPSSTIHWTFHSQTATICTTTSIIKCFQIHG